MLSDRLCDEFSKSTRRKGTDYFAAGRVRLVEESPVWVEARVSGTEDYAVHLAIDRRSSRWDVSASCDCPFFDDRLEPCKHIWAVLRTLDTRPVFLKLPKLIQFNLMLGEGFDDDEDKPYPTSTRDYADSDPSNERLLLMARDVVDSLNAGPGPGRPPRPKMPSEPEWMKFLNQVAHLTSRSVVHDHPWDRTTITPLYQLKQDPPMPGSVSGTGRFVLQLTQQRTTSTGRLGKLKQLTLRASDLPRLASDLDRRVCLMLAGLGSGQQYGYYYQYQSVGTLSQCVVPSRVQETLLPLLFETGRFQFLAHGAESPLPITWDDGPSWEFALALEPGPKAGRLRLSGILRRGEVQRALSSADFLIRGEPALLVRDGVMSRLEVHGCFEWLDLLISGKSPEIPAGDRTRLLDTLAATERIPPLSLPADWNVATIREPPVPVLSLELSEGSSHTNSSTVAGRLAFQYGRLRVPSHRLGTVMLDAKARQQLLRQPAAEQRAIDRLIELGFERARDGPGFALPVRELPTVAQTLLAEGWQVLGRDLLLRAAGTFSMEFTSGVDWFDLAGHVEFGDQQVALPALLEAVRAGERFVKLGDGSLGLLPEDWLGRYARLMELGEVSGDHVRFTRTQIGLIDALLAQMPEARFDEKLAQARERLAAFSGIRPVDPPEAFTGTLRGYQREGLGWLGFLRDLGWGGCLADDMGLGKTVQVLALLEDRRRSGGGPSLVVVPKSLVFNWVREAQRFTPGLRVLDYTGTDRRKARSALSDHDVVLTTYGTLKRDVDSLRGVEFDYAILDEAQAIKNPTSQNAKASRLINARHRLVMTGTPVENRMSDLWSLFEFANPGMLGGKTSFGRAFIRGAPGQEGNGDEVAVLQKVLRPFILRRTKQHVATDLPARSEETIECTMGTKQSAYYRELRDFYRASLLGRIEKQGLAKSKVYVLEALLRLRQAACHPGLVDESRSDEESAKLEAMLPMITQLVEEGHKALIFSQFVTMLSIVRDALDKEGLVYEYLDGQTRARSARVDRFQNDEKCPLFLISLKAGGVGLNLTAADYVFILDPWWNPAVEAQAIDRTHRIGQDKHVIAYRLIARDTVESKIIELQQRKRKLADAIITEQNSVIADLTRQDLELLLG